MIEILQPGFRTGAVHIPASKSQAHRLLICAALSQNETVIRRRGSLSVRKPGHCAGHGLRFQVLPPFLGRF